MQINNRKLSKEEFPAWDVLVATSPQAGLFHTTTWNQMLHETAPEGYEYEHIICEKDGTPLGGICLHHVRSGSKKQIVTPMLGYNGPFFSPEVNYQEPYRTIPGYEVGTELLKCINQLTGRAMIRNQPEIWDMRAYFYNGWQVKMNYTHLLACPSPNEVWEAMDTPSREEILKGRYVITVNGTNKQIQKFSLSAFNTNGGTRFFRTSEREILLKRLHWIKERGWCQIVTLSDETGREQAMALFILSKENRTIYLWEMIQFTKGKECSMFSSLIWQSYLSFGANFDRLDLGASTSMSMSLAKDRLGGILTPFYVAMCDRN